MKDLKICMLAILALMAMSCQKESAGDDEWVCLQVSLSTEDISRSGANALPTRYVMEVYENGKTQECLSHQEFENSTFNVSLPRGTFDLYFWADYGMKDKGGRYNVASLASVSQDGEQGGEDCFAGSQRGVNLYEKESSLAVTLRRPVACIRYMNKDGGNLATEEIVSVTYYSLNVSYNVITGRVNGESSLVTRKLLPMLDEDYFATDYVFISSEEKKALDIKLKIGEREKMMTDINVKSNVETRIQGNFY